MIGHLSFGVADLSRATAFYDAALGALGYTRVWINEHGAGYGLPGGNDKLALFPQDHMPEPRPGCHVAFVADSRAAVDLFHASALRAGGVCNGSPGLRPDYGPAYYAAFVIDPDGYRIEAVVQ